MSDIVFLPITCCKECPRCELRRDYASNNCEAEYDLFCILDQDHRKIAKINQFVQDPAIPDWCPLRKQNGT